MEYLNESQKEMASLLHSQWLNSAETKSFLCNIQSKQIEHLQYAMNLVERADVTKEQLLIQLAKAKTLTDLLTYVKTTPESIIVQSTK